MAEIVITWELLTGREWRGFVRGHPDLVLNANPYQWSIERADPTGSKEGSVRLAHGHVYEHDVTRAMRAKSRQISPLELSKVRAEKWLDRHRVEAGLEPACTPGP